MSDHRTTIHNVEIKVRSNMNPKEMAAGIRKILEEIAKLPHEKIMDFELEGVDDPSTTCGTCNQDFPYAKPRVNFICWGCKNVP